MERRALRQDHLSDRIKALKIPTGLKRFPWFELVLVLTLLAVHVSAATAEAHQFPNQWFTRDDAYYYFKVAQNISEGSGSTFDGLNPTNGYHPLWMLVCIPVFTLARLDLILPLRVLLVLLAALRAVTSILIYRTLKRRLSLPVAILASAYWAFSYPIHATVYQQGLETGLAAFSLVLFLFLLEAFDRQQGRSGFSSKQVAVLGAAGVLLALSRLDLVFLAAILGLWIALRNDPVRPLLLTDLLVILCSLVAAVLMRIDLREYHHYETFTLVALGASLATKLPALWYFGLYSEARDLPPGRLVLRSALAIMAANGALFLGLYGASRLGILAGNFPRSIPFLEAGISLPLLIASRFAIRKLSTSTVPGRRATLPDNPVLRVRAWLSRSWLYFSILAGAIGSYMAWNRLSFGGFSPVSGQVKSWWGSFTSNVYGGTARTGLKFFGIAPAGDFNAWAPATTTAARWFERLAPGPAAIDSELRFGLFLGALICGAGAVLLIIQRRRSVRLAGELALLPLLVGAQVQVLYYNLTRYAAVKEWYWVAQLVTLLLAGALALDVISAPLRKVRAGKAALLALALLLSLDLAMDSTRLTLASMREAHTAAGRPLMESAAFIERHTEPGSLVGMTGGGNVGYFIQDRTIVNMDGLINSYAYFRAHRSKAGSDYLAELGLDYIFANPDFLETQPYRGQYTGRLEVLDYYGGKAIMRFLPASSAR